MKQRRFVVVLALAITLGGVAGLLALRFLSQQATPLLATEPPSGKLVVAAMDLPLGTVLRAEDVRVIDWHSNELPEGYYGSTAEVIGRGLITAVAANEPLMATKLADKESGGGLPIVIPEGMRGLSVRVDEVIGVAGFVLPGTRVDVLLTITPEGGNDQPPVTRIILQNIQTLASGQTIQRDANGTPQTVSVVTLLVTPEQAERLTLAANEGRIQLALRNTLDMAEVETPGIRTTSLVTPPRSGPRTGGGTAVRVAAPTRSENASSVVVEMIKGGERTLSTFQTRP